MKWSIISAASLCSWLFLYSVAFLHKIRISNDPGGYRWPPTYSIWTSTINSCRFSHSAQLTIFSRFSGPPLSEPFWGLNDPGGYWWPPTYSIWTPIFSSFNFQVATKLTIFSSFSGPELSEPFWGPKRHFLGKRSATWVHGPMLPVPKLKSSDRSF